ncbi:MAG: PQQ-binding-like beta-propeller repeat protein [Candidatus Cybelea sp.]
MTPLGRRFWAWLVTIAMVAAGISACAAHAAVSKSPAAATGNAKSLAGSTGDEGWYSRDQATQGATLFGQKCAVCHGAKLQGGAGPALAGKQFFLRFGGKPLSQLWYDVHTEMPLNAPSSLPNADSLALVAFILQQNGFPEGASPIVGHYDTSRIIPSAAPGAATAQATPVAAATPMIVRQPSTSAPAQRELNSADTNADNWLAYGKGYSASRYSALSQISTANVARLKPRCSVELAPGGSFEGSPVAYGGILYVTTTNGTFAVNGRTCAKLWSYQYAATDIAAGANNKGVAIGGGRVIRGTVDGHLIALDIKTGNVLWDRKIMNSSAGASALAAPLIWNGLVFMPKAGGDVGVRGEFMAFRVSDGTKVWSFSAIPIGDETGAKSWQPRSAAMHGGGGIWTYFALDPKTGTIFAPVGNPGPDFDSTQRKGANLFTTGIVALDARTGKLRWSYQTEPNDDHDWDATGAALFDLGRREFLAGTSKDGIVHLLDRTNGKLLTKTPTTTIANAAAPITPSGTHYCPGVTGGSEWNGAAWNPTTKLVYVNSVDWCVTVKRSASPSMTNINQLANAKQVSSFGGGIPLPDPMDKAYGWTTAVDPATGNVKWHVKMATPMIAALTPTAGGLVFTGDLNGEFLALDATTGDVLYRYDTKGAMAGGIVTYRAGGKQYVAGASGNTSFVAWRVTGKPTLVVFGL